MKSIADVIGDPVVFLDKLFLKLEENGLDASAYFLDHLCYRIGTQEEYTTKKAEIAPLATLLIESMVNGRLIATYKLHSPIVYKERLIDVIELPAPKPGHSYMSGLEHIEFVTELPLKEMLEKYPHLTFETFGIDKKINADITLKLGEYCVRFHNQSLEEIIELEKNL